MVWGRTEGKDFLNQELAARDTQEHRLSARSEGVGPVADDHFISLVDAVSYGVERRD